MEETLNIDYHTRRLVLKAMNKHRRIKEAALALGISERWLQELRHRYGVYLDRGTWKAPEINLSQSMRPLQSVA